jgi:hypothetical protein
MIGYGVRGLDRDRTSQWRRGRICLRSRKASRSRGSDSPLPGEGMGKGGCLFDEIGNLVEPTERRYRDVPAGRSEAGCRSVTARTARPTKNKAGSRRGCGCNMPRRSMRPGWEWRERRPPPAATNASLKRAVAGICAHALRSCITDKRSLTA